MIDKKTSDILNDQLGRWLEEEWATDREIDELEIVLEERKNRLAAIRINIEEIRRLLS